MVAIAAAAADAALEPSPLPSGRPFSSWRETPAPFPRAPHSLSMSRSVSIAAMPAQLFLLSSVSLPWSPSMDSITTRSSRDLAPPASSKGFAVTVSPRPSTAHPSRSKPGPRFATVDGAKAAE